MLLLAVFCLSFVVVATSKDEQVAFQCDACGYETLYAIFCQHAAASLP